MDKSISAKMLVTSGISGLIGVAAGAFGSHILKGHLSAEMLEIFKTGVLYQLIHSVVIFAISVSGIQRLTKASLFFAAGIVLFSFSLYAYSLTSIKFITMITPLGGISFLAGWLMLIINGIKSN
ncbi:MAG: hypothetical protein HGGPFJEG_01049 [Ignavibacteria bacterium]|nr:hypothetical protein [Ignavibacteria bacterium]